METSGLKLKESQESLDLFSTLDVFLAAKDHRGTNLTQTQVYLKCPQRHTLTGGWSSIVFSFKAPTFLIFLHSFFFPMFIPLTINSLFGVKLCPSYTLDHTGCDKMSTVSPCGWSESRPESKRLPVWSLTVPCVQKHKNMGFKALLDQHCCTSCTVLPLNGTQGLQCMLLKVQSSAGHSYRGLSRVIWSFPPPFSSLSIICFTVRNK